MTAFVKALKPTTKFPMGSLPKLRILGIGGNPGNKIGVKVACSARGIHCDT